jgi:DNA-binding MarR family transcriptional regulator
VARVELEPVADDLLRVMASIRRSGRRLAPRPAELSQLTGAQLDLVRLVRRRPGVSVGEAAEELGVAPNTVSTLVRQLADAGLLTRAPGADDRRVARLDLTEEMSRRVDVFRDRRVALLSEAMARLSEDERERLAGAVEVLGRLAELLPDRVEAHV